MQGRTEGLGVCRRGRERGAVGGFRRESETVSVFNRKNSGGERSDSRERNGPTDNHRERTQHYGPEVRGPCSWACDTCRVGGVTLRQEKEEALGVKTG